MQGLTYVIDKLGATLATTEQALAQTQEENAILRGRIAELEQAAASPDGATAPRKGA